jgi:hypothetical protein
MVRDYSERRQMRTSMPPKRPSVWPYVLLILLLLLLAYLLGVATGWYLYRPGGRFYKALVTAPPPVPQPKGTALPPQGEPIVPATSPNSAPTAQNPPSGQPPFEKGSGAPPLTFYNTLQKGNKGLIGTGINHPKEGQQSAPPQITAPKTTAPQSTDR